MSRRLVLAFVLAALLSGALPFATAARPNDDQGLFESRPGPTVQVLARSSPYRSKPIPPSVLGEQNESVLTPGADIQVAYGAGFPSDAQSVMEAAVAVWESHIVSPRIIHVYATWTSGLPSGVLAETYPNELRRFGDAVWYPAALLEAICNCEATTNEISISFNSAQPWYRDIDGNVAAGQFDLYTIVLHEVGHGLGFVSSFTVSGLTGGWGRYDGLPLGFDLYEWDSATGGNLLTNTGVYPDPSSELKTQLTDDSVYFGGPNVVAEYGGRAPLFAPAPWQPGSSNCHFDETVFGPGTINGLMTPYFDDGEAIHDPGPLALALFRDIGWTLTGDASVPGAPTGASATAGNAQALVSWVAPADDGSSPIIDYTATSEPDGISCTTAGLSCTVGGLTNATPYTFTVTARNAVGSGPPSDPSNSVTPQPPAGPANDSFASAAAISGLSGTVSGSNVNATGQSGEPLNTSTSAPIQSVWYAWTAPAAGNAAIDLCGSSFDTTLGVYSGPAVGSLTAIASNDDDPSLTCGLDSRVSFAASAGTTYRISVDGYQSAQGAIVLTYSLAGTDTTPPTVQAPSRALFAPGALGKTALLRLSWPAASDPSGIAAYELQRKKGTGAWTNVPLSSPTATSVDVAVKPGTNYTFRLRARDGANNTGPWVTTNAAKTALVQETPSAKLLYSGAFKRSALAGASGGYVRQTGVAGRTVRLTFTGSSVAFVSTRAKARGMAEVRIDGGAWVTIDLYAATKQTKRLVWAASVTPGTHTLEIRVKGLKSAAATGTRVDIDAFLVQP